jgi:hypothetical protein
MPSLCSTDAMSGTASEAIAVVEGALAEQAIRPGMLTLGTDNG